MIEKGIEREKKSQSRKENGLDVKELVRVIVE